MLLTFGISIKYGFCLKIIRFAPSGCKENRYHKIRIFTFLQIVNMLISFLSKGTHAPSPSEYPDLPFYRMSPPSSSSTPPSLATPSPPLVKLVVGITVSWRLLRIKTFKIFSSAQLGEEGQSQQFLVRATFYLFSRPSHIKIIVLPTDEDAYLQNIA